VNIKVVKKEDQGADTEACMALALLMAVRTLGGTDISKEEVYRRAECVGRGNLALPWGVCRAAHELGFRITLGSKNPRHLVDYGEFRSISGFDRATAESYVDRLVAFCTANQMTINLVEYPTMIGQVFKSKLKGYPRFMEDIVHNELGVLFVTLNWAGAVNHTLPIKEFTTREVVLVDCNACAADELALTRSEFEQRWNDPATDNDFFVLWKTQR
jgi:hypothetical protein